MPLVTLDPAGVPLRVDTLLEDGLDAFVVKTCDVFTIEADQSNGQAVLMEALGIVRHFKGLCASNLNYSYLRLVHIGDELTTATEDDSAAIADNSIRVLKYILRNEYDAVIPNEEVDPEDFE